MAQHKGSNNPKRFAIRDPCGGYWGGEGSKYGKKLKLLIKFKLIFVSYICIFVTFLSPDIKGVITVGRSTLLFMIVRVAHITTNF